jgi:hypothetical protein
MTTTIQVGNEQQLNQALATVDAAASGAYLIQFTADITEASELYAINLKSGVTLTIDGQGHKLDGANQYRGLFALAGAVTIQNLTITDATAQGTDGVAGKAASGGGGAGWAEGSSSGQAPKSP